MSTTIRPETSTSNPYWIDKHRYYELKHFCLQYPIWKQAYEAIDGMAKRPDATIIFSQRYGNPTEKCVEMRLFYSDRMEMIENAANDADLVIGKYILEGVTEGIPYDILRMRHDVPCGKNAYYELYRRFFWLLSNNRK